MESAQPIAKKARIEQTLECDISSNEESPTSISNLTVENNVDDEELPAISLVTTPMQCSQEETVLDATATAMLKGRSVALVIFRTASKGWGARAASDIRRGKFVDEYFGNPLLMTYT